MEPATWIVPIVQEVVRRVLPKPSRDRRRITERLEEVTAEALAIQHQAVASWSEEAHTHFAGVRNRAPTIELTFSSLPRRFGTGGGEQLDELDVLVAEHHITVLGDPGAGKTTTLRRLARYVTQAPEQATGDDFRFVVLVVCRDERFDKESLFQVVGSKVGLSDSLAEDLDDPRTWLYKLLDAGALLIIDGLDEVPGAQRVDLERAITELGRHLSRGRIIVSCRSADYMPLEGFQIAEILPLSDNQIREMTAALLEDGDVEAFHAQLRKSHQSSVDLANRPLFLGQLIQIYNAQGTIPQRATDLQEAIVRLIIQEWDEQRRVHRASEYAQFIPTQKQRFLSDLALDLLRNDLITFSEADLAGAYERLAERYGLPKGEARKVARELESHTGLLVHVGTHYEYSHLSLQEYLAADSLVRGGPAAIEAWWRYPAVVAVATALSSDATAWFKELTRRFPRPQQIDKRAVHSYLRRIAQESPRFTRDKELGHELLEMVWRVQLSDPDLAEQLGQWKPLRDSVADALGDFTSLTTSGSKIRMAIYEGHSPEAKRVISVNALFLTSFLGADRFRQVVSIGD